MSSLRLSQHFAMRRTVPSGTRIATVRAARSYHRTRPQLYPYKDDQDRDSLNPRSTEYSKSGSDDEVAAQDEAFDPHKTSPEAQKQSSGELDKNGHNPLDVSPASQESSQPRDAEEGGATRAPGESTEGRDRTSARGSPKKSGGGKYGSGTTGVQ